MKNYYKIILTIFLVFHFNNSFAEKKYFIEGKKLFNTKKYEKAKFKFEQEILFNPKSEKSYLYLAKIFKIKEKIILEENNLKTVLLLNPKNEDAIYALALLNLKNSNFSETKLLTKKLKKVCNKLCEEINDLEKKLKNALKN